MNRWWVIAPLLGASALLNLLADPRPREAEVVPAVVKEHPPAGPPVILASSGVESAAPGSHALIPRDRLYPSDGIHATGGDLFGRREWAASAPSAPASAPLADAKPTFPYTYAGRRQDGEAIEVYLTRDELAFLGRAGDTLDGAFRIDSITSTELTVTHLPSKHKHVLRIGEPD